MNSVLLPNPWIEDLNYSNHHGPMETRFYGNVNLKKWVYTFQTKVVCCGHDSTNFGLLIFLNSVLSQFLVGSLVMMCPFTLKLQTNLKLVWWWLKISVKVKYKSNNLLGVSEKTLISTWPHWFKHLVLGETGKYWTAIIMTNTSSGLLLLTRWKWLSGMQNFQL